MLSLVLHLLLRSSIPQSSRIHQPPPRLVPSRLPLVGLTRSHKDLVRLHLRPPLKQSRSVKATQMHGPTPHASSSPVPFSLVYSLETGFLLPRPKLSRLASGMSSVAPGMKKCLSSSRLEKRRAKDSSLCSARSVPPAQHLLAPSAHTLSKNTVLLPVSRVTSFHQFARLTSSRYIGRAVYLGSSRDVSIPLRLPCLAICLPNPRRDSCVWPHRRSSFPRPALCFLAPSFATLCSPTTPLHTTCIRHAARLT